MAAKAWIQQYVSEEEGHAQQKTGDEFQHLQGMKQNQLLEKYEGWHKEESASSGRPPPMCSKSTFNRAMDEMRETRKLRPELEALHCAPYTINHDALCIAGACPKWCEVSQAQDATGMLPMFIPSNTAGQSTACQA